MSKKRLSDYSHMTKRFKIILMDNFKNIATNLFVYKNLPHHIKPSYIENLLYDNGIASYYKDPIIDDVVLSVGGEHDLNIYGEPLKWRMIGNNYNKAVNNTNAVMLKNTRSGSNTKNMVEHFVDTIVELEYSKKINLMWQRLPYILSTTKTEKNVMEKLFQDLMGFKPLIVIDETIRDFENSLKDFKIDVEYKVEKFNQDILQEENKLLTYLGINTIDIYKKERLITNEAESGKEKTNAYLEMRLTARKEFVEKINQMYGYNIIVEKNFELIEQVQELYEKGVENEETI